MFNVLRIQKKQKIEYLNAAEAHNARHGTGIEDRVNIITAQTKLNQRFFIANMKQGTLIENYHAEMKSIIKPRKDSVLATELVLSASPEYFRDDATAVGTWDDDKLNAWKDAVLNFTKNELSKTGRLLDITLHLDEATPHFHIVLIPVKDGKLNHKHHFGKTIANKKVTDENGQVTKVTTGKNNILEWHTTFAKYTSHLGLNRGTGDKANRLASVEDYKDYKKKVKDVVDHPLLQKPTIKKPKPLPELNAIEKAFKSEQRKKMEKEYESNLKKYQDAWTKYYQALDVSLPTLIDRSKRLDDLESKAKKLTSENAALRKLAKTDEVQNLKNKIEALTQSAREQNSYFQKQVAALQNPEILPNFNERTLRNSEATFDDLIAKATPLENIIDKSKHDQVINTVKLFAEERTKKAIKGKEGWLNFLAGGEINGYSLSNNPRKFVLELARNRANKEQKLDGYNIPQAFVADYLKKKGMDYEAQSYLSEYKKFSSGNEAAKAMGNDNQLTQKTGSSLKM